MYKLPGHQGSVNDVDFHPKEPICKCMGVLCVYACASMCIVCMCVLMFICAVLYYKVSNCI